MDKLKTVVRAYSLAILTVILATVIRWMLEPYMLGLMPFPTYFAAVAFVGMYAGFGPALLTMVAGALIGDFLFIPPRGELLIGTPDVAVGLVVYAMTSLVIIGLTERLRASRMRVSESHQQIEMSNRLLRRIADTVPILFSYVNRELRYEYTSAGYERWFQLPAGEIRGQRIQDVESGRMFINIEPYAQRALSGEMVDFEQIFTDKDELRRYLHIQFIPDYSDDPAAPQVQGFFVVIIDLTDRRKLAEREAQLAAIVTSAQEAILTKSLDGIVISWNRGAERVYGYSAEEIVGTSIERLSAPTRRDEARWISSEIRAGRTIDSFETVRVRKDGTMVDILLSAAPVRDARGDIIAIAAIERDISDRKQAERVLISALEEAEEGRRKLREADKRKDQFLSMLAHELRNPLAPIANAVQVLLLEGGKHGGRIDWVAGVIDRQTKHLTHLVDDLLDVARINAGRIQLRRSIVNLAGLLRQCAENAQTMFNSRGLQLHLDIETHEALTADVDPSRITQIIDNLLDNATKYTDPGGEVSLQLRREHEHAVVRVCDTGIGIEPEHLPRIFELFEQVDASLDRSGGGLGLGLNLVRRLVEMHGGEISAESPGRGQGSVFMIRLPLSQAEQSPRRDGSAPEVLTICHCKVLVVEDNNDVAQSMLMLLEMLGHTVQVATSGQRGLDLAEVFRPDLVLLDIGLPDINGFEVARLLRDRYGANLQLVAVTGYGQEEYRRRSMEAGFDAHLVKPPSIEGLSGVLSRCAPNHQEAETESSLDSNVGQHNA